MAITKSGLFGLTLEKMFVDTLARSVEAETHNVAMITDSATPNFTTNDFFNDLEANEVSGTGYTARGTNLTTTEFTLAADVAKFDGDDVTWPTSTITSAMAAVGIFDSGASATDELHFLSDFVTAASSSGGTFTITWAAAGIYTISFAP